MGTKVEFIIRDRLTHYFPAIEQSLRQKMKEKIIELPYTPTKEMGVNISSFADIYGFTAKERKLIEDEIFRIDYMNINADKLEVWLADD